MTYPISGATLYACGDSITEGRNASSYVSLGYAYRLAGKYGLSIQNDAIPSTGAYRGSIIGFTHYQTSGSQLNAAFLWAMGHNDGNFYAPKCETKYSSELTSYLTHAWAVTSVPARNFTLSGSWTDLNKADSKSRLGFGVDLKASSTPGDKISGTISGDNIVVRCYDGNGTAGNRILPFSLKVDGLLVATYAGDNTSNGCPLDGVSQTHHAVFVEGLGVGSHSFELEVLSGTGTCYIDTIDTVRHPNECEMAIVLFPPRPNNYALTGLGTATAADFDKLDNAILSVAATLSSYPITIVRTNDYLNPANIDTDHSHPTDAGHKDMCNACSAAFVCSYPITNSYSTGVWTPIDSSGSGVGFTVNYAKYFKHGNKVTVNCHVMYASSGSSAPVVISGLPYAVEAGCYGVGSVNTNSGVSFVARANAGSQDIVLLTTLNTNVSVSQMSGNFLVISMEYFVA